MEFYELANHGDPMFVSASKWTGVTELLDKVSEHFAADAAVVDTAAEAAAEVRRSGPHR